MSEGLDKTDPDVYEEHSQAALEQLLAGDRGRDVIADLIEHGIDEADAKKIVASMMFVAQDMKEAKADEVADVREGVKLIWFGAILAGVAAGVTGYSYYQAVSRGGGLYVTYYRIMFIGSAIAIYGSIKYWLTR